MNILITGGAGFIGTALTRKLLDSGMSVRVLDKQGYGFRPDFAEINPEAKLTILECESELLPAVLTDMGEIDVLLIMHSESHVDRSIDESRPFVLSNVLGTTNLLDAFYTNHKYEGSKLPKVFLFSTDEVLGETSGADENAPYHPNNPYSFTKAAQELALVAYAHTYGFKGVITRCCNVFGPGQAVEKFIPRSITSLLKDETLKLYGSGVESRQWVYLDDVTDAALSVVKFVSEYAGTEIETFHIGGDYSLPNAKLAEMICEAVGKPKSRIELVENRLGHDRSYLLNYFKFARTFIWRPKVSLMTGLGRTVDFYRGDEARR